MQITSYEFTFLGFTSIPNVVNLVSPPSSTSFRYKKKVSIRCPVGALFL